MVTDRKEWAQNEYNRLKAEKSRLEKRQAEIEELLKTFIQVNSLIRPSPWYLVLHIILLAISQKY